jgi:hypothetical protein
MRFLRYHLPVLIIISGFLLLLIRGTNDNALWGAASLWGAGLSVFFLNWLYRLGVSGDKDRDHEADARRYLAEHGHWPDEAPADKRE